jgi:hypothetical protein
MTVEEAGDYYLDAVCPVNALIDPYDAEEEAVWNRGGGDLTQLKALATEIKDTMQASAAMLSNPEVLWPSGLAEDASLIADNYYGGMSYYNQVLAAEDFSDLQAAIYPEDASASAGPKIRSVLGLSTDPIASCQERS